MANFVPPEGTRSARLVLLGEAPGGHENTQRRPFVGPSGGKLYGWWDNCGLRRHDFLIDNVYPYQPPNNNLTKVPKKELQEHITNLHVKLSELEDPYVIVPTGNTALEALTGHREITKYRGSILSYTDLDGRIIKVIPTLHPAYLLWTRDPMKDRICQMDWIRIAEEAQFPELRLPVREHIIYSREAFVRFEQQEHFKNFYREMMANAKALSIDIETPGGKIVCVAFSFRPDQSLTIPMNEETLPLIKELCACPVPKVFQNGHFDNFYFHFDKIKVRNWYWDTLAMHHCLEPAMPHDLATMASLYTRQPYWKDEAKDPEKIAKYATSYEALYTYNGIDACVTIELFNIFRQRLREAGRVPFFKRHYRKMFLPLLSIMTHGIRVDIKKRRQMAAECEERRREIKQKLEEFAGFSLWGPKGALSHQKVCKLLYEKMRLPKQYNRSIRGRGHFPLTTNEVALKRLLQKYPDRCADVVHLLLEDRRKAKLLTFLNEAQMDKDGRLRCSLRFTTDTGRLSSSKNPWGTGANLQNQDREIHSTFIPDEDP